MPRRTNARPTCTGQFVLLPSGKGLLNRGEAFDEVPILGADQGTALDGDTVEAELFVDGREERARVLAIVARGRTRMSGVLRAGSVPNLALDDPRIHARVVVSERGEARVGESVLAEIESYPSAYGEPITVHVTRVLGEPGAVVTEVTRRIAMSGVAESFSPRAEREVSALPSAVTLDSDESGRRADLRDLHFVTIDPRTARDFDDAVCVAPLADAEGGGHRVWVAVADVAHYIPEGSPLDQEARQRGCSVYLPDRAIPMLPHALSAGICSLVPDQDRLAMVVRFDVDPAGAVVDEGCMAAVIHSRGQLDYGGVAAALDGEFVGRREAYRAHETLLFQLRAVAETLRRARLRRGSLDLDLPEAQVQLDEDDPYRIRGITESRPDAPIKRAYNLIEELMVAANELVARRFLATRTPTLWRIHAPPRRQALEQLAEWLWAYGLGFEVDGLQSPRGLGRAIQALAGHAAARPLCYLTLRALKQAVYSTKNVGHFGLASQAYLHFTSPIRRYPDLQVHRLLKGILRKAGEPAGKRITVRSRTLAALDEIAHDATTAERRSIELEREVHRVYAAALMRDRMGETHHGRVSGLSRVGLFVTLDDPYVDGLVRITDTERSVRFDAGRMQLTARGGEVAFSLGDPVEVEVVEASVQRGQVDLHLRNHPWAKGSDKPAGRTPDDATPSAPHDAEPLPFAKYRTPRGSRRSAEGRQRKSTSRKAGLSRRRR